MATHIGLKDNTMRIEIIAKTADGQQIAFGNTTVSAEHPYRDLLLYVSEQWETKTLTDLRDKDR